MTEFKTVHDSRVEEPTTIDTTSSETTVYERKNIRQETVTRGEGDDAITTTEWVYEQREYTREEYNMMLSPAIQGVQQALSNIELAIAML